MPRRSDGTPVARDEAPAEGRRAAPTAGDEAAPPRAGGSTPAPPLVRPSRALVPLGAVASCVLLAEGALNDWSAVYLARVHDAAPAAAAAGLAVFSLTMGGARLVGDRLAAAFGTRAVARGGLVIGAAGFAAAAVAPSPSPRSSRSRGSGSASPLSIRSRCARPASGATSRRGGDRGGHDARLRRLPARPAARRPAGARDVAAWSRWRRSAACACRRRGWRAP